MSYTCDSPRILIGMSLIHLLPAWPCSTKSATDLLPPLCHCCNHPAGHDYLRMSVTIKIVLYAHQSQNIEQNAARSMINKMNLKKSKLRQDMHHFYVQVNGKIVCSLLTWFLGWFVWSLIAYVLSERWGNDTILIIILIQAQWIHGMSCNSLTGLNDRQSVEVRSFFKNETCIYSKITPFFY